MLIIIIIPFHIYLYIVHNLLLQISHILTTSVTCYFRWNIQDIAHMRHHHITFLLSAIARTCDYYYQDRTFISSKVFFKIKIA